MDHGAAWIVIEESYQQGTRRLLSILPARRNRNEVIAFVQQCYVDRFASIDEKLLFKKHPKQPPFTVFADQYGGPIYIGQEPVYVGIYAYKIRLQDMVLEFQYRIVVDRNNLLEPKFETRSQSLMIHA